MYQTIVLGLGFLLVIGGGWLIQTMDTEGVLASKFTQTKTINATSTTVATATPERNLQGRYLCDSDSGCPNPSLLTLTSEGEVSMSTTYDNGVEMLQERGTWKNEKRDAATVIITGTDADIYASPRILSIRYVSPSALSGITFDARIYKDWVRPVFRKQENEQ